jgi:hypothetical protein
MAHTPETRTTMDNILKYVYHDSIVDSIAKQVKLYTLFQKKAARMGYGGKSFIVPIELNYMGSTGARAESGTLPDSTPGVALNSVVPIYYNYFAVSVTGPAMATSSENKYAFAEAWSREVKNKTRSFQQHMNRQLNGDGDGILAQVDGTPSLNGSDYTITLDNAYGLSGFNNSDVNGHRFTSINQLVDFYSGSSKRDTGAVKITGYTRGSFPNTSATVICADGDCDEVADGDYMYVAGAYGNEMPGIILLIDDGTQAATFQSINTNTYWEWKSHIGYGATPGTAEALTVNRIQTTIDDIESSGGGNVDFMYTSNAVYLTLGELSRTERLITNPKVLDPGWKVLEYNGMEIHSDPYCVDVLYLFDNRAVKLFEARPQGWLQEDGNALIRTTNKDEYEAYWGWYATPGVINRQWLGKIVDISVIANKL